MAGVTEPIARRITTKAVDREEQIEKVINQHSVERPQSLPA